MSVSCVGVCVCYVSQSFVRFLFLVFFLHQFAFV